MMKTASPIFFFIGFLLVLFACCRKPCETRKSPTYYLSNSDKALIKYTGTDTIRYLHNHSDTLTFIGRGIKSFFSSIATGGADCPSPDNIEEGREFRFINKSDSTNEIFLNQALFNNTSVSNVDFDFLNRMFSFSISDIEYFADDTLTILNQTYHHVCRNEPNPQTDYSDSLYYDRYDGIIKVSTKTDLWELIK